MRDSLQLENESLRRQIEALLLQARKNEEKMRRFDQLERRLIGTRSLVELVGLLLVDYRAAFELDAVTLALVDPQYESARILEADRGEGAPMTGLFLLDTVVVLENLYGGSVSPILGAYEHDTHAALFGAATSAIASVALLPLMCHGALIGSLNLGSSEAQRFAADSATDLLAHLAAIVAVCLDSALSHERLKLAGLTDPLTNVSNRRYFERRCVEEITYAHRHALPLTCMFLDIDRFKRINDTLGHLAGDEVLRQVAKRIKSELRGSDILARYGGEEFVALLPHTAIRHAGEIAERIRSAVAARPFEASPGDELAVTVSIGIAALPGPSLEKDNSVLAGNLVAAADKALYHAKQAGRNRVVSELVRPPARRHWKSVCHRVMRGSFRPARRTRFPVFDLRRAKRLILAAAFGR